MIEKDDERDRRDREMGLTWWVRYAIVPIAVALIAGIRARLAIFTLTS